MFAEKNWFWQRSVNIDDSNYIPIYEVVPRLRLYKKEEVFSFNRKNNMLYWDAQLDGDVLRSFNEGEIRRSTYFGHITTSFFAIFAFIPEWISFVPRAGYGMQKYFSKSKEPQLDVENGRHSFHFLFTNNALQLGPNEIFLKTTHLYRFTFRQEIEDVTYGAENEDKLIFNLGTSPIPGMFGEILTARDLRSVPYPLAEQRRWDDLVVNTSVYIDFFKPFQKDYSILYEYNSVYYMGLDLTNSYIYYTPNEKSLLNTLAASIKSGHFSIPGLYLKEVEASSVGMAWYHSFYHFALDQMRFTWSVSFWLNNYWRFIVGANSVTERAYRYFLDETYADYVPFHKDVLQGMNFFSGDNSMENVFNIENFHFVVQHDLHAWLLEFSYFLKRRDVSFGKGNRNDFAFYDHVFYFSLQLKGLTSFGIPRSEIYRTAPEDELDMRGLR